MDLPVHLQNALTRIGGKRLNGEPNYKFVWSADFTYQISNGKGYEPFRVVAEDCWLLVKYELPEFWGTKAEWEINNWEMGTVVASESGLATIEPLFTAGPYPSQGRYRTIMRIKRQVILDGQPYMEHCAPTMKWVEEYFPGVRDFQNLTVEEKAAFITKREADEKAVLAKSFGASRDNYRGAASQKQVSDRIEKLEKFLADPSNIQKALRSE